MKTIYWSPYTAGNPNIRQVSELAYSDPENLLTSIEPTKYFGPNASRCAAITNECRNTFKIKSPIDVSITFKDDFSGYESKYPLFQQEDRDFIEHLIGAFGPEKVIQLASPTYLFYCEESLLMTQLPPYYEESTFVDNCLGLSATFDIGNWFRMVKPSFKLRKKAHTIEFLKDTALMYLKFNTEEKVKLVRFDGSVFAKNHKDILDNIMSFKYFTKSPLIPTSLSENYMAFRKARYNKKVMKIIRDNIIE